MFINVLEAERRENEFAAMVERLAYLPADRLARLDTMLGAKRQINNAIAPNSSIARFLNSVDPNTSSILQRRVNSCMSAIDRTSDNNIMSMMGAVFDASGIDTLLFMHAQLGSNFVEIANTLANVYQLGPNAIYNLQAAFREGVQQTLIDSITIATEAANEVINGVAEAAFCAILPSLAELQNQIGDVLGPVSDIVGAIDSLTEQVTGTINNTLISLQNEVNSLSNVISGGLFNYATRPGGTCANRPDSQLGIRQAISGAIGCK